MDCLGFHCHENTISLHLKIFFFLVTPLYKPLHIFLLLLPLMLFTYRRRFLQEKKVFPSSVFLYKVRGLWIHLGSLDPDINCIVLVILNTLGMRAFPLEISFSQKMLLHRLLLSVCSNRPLNTCLLPHRNGT